MDREIRTSFSERDSRITLFNRQLDIVKASVENLNEKLHNMKLNSK